MQAAEGSGRGLISVTFQNLPGGTEEVHNKSQSECLVFLCEIRSRILPYLNQNCCPETERSV